MKQEQERLEVMMISETYAADLRGRQSVRTTFKLSPHCIDALSLLAGQLGIKQKSIVDHLVDDTQALHALARDNEVREAMTTHRIAKTYVVSRRTIERLERVSKRFKTPRDILVESSIERILPLLREEKRKHEQRVCLQDKLSRLLLDSQQLLHEADGTLDHDDPVLGAIVQMASSIQSGCAEVEQVIEKGKKLENF